MRPSLPVPEVFAPLLQAPSRAGLFCDFDGTLSEIVDEPADARPVPGVAEVLVDLAGVLGTVGVLSGRPVGFLTPLFPPPIGLSGLYGLETSIDGVRHDHPQGGAWREVVDDVAATASARGPAGVRVEHKGLSLTLHFRGTPEIEAEVLAFADQQAARSGLLVRPAKMSVELHPPVPADKGTALRELTDDLSVVAFFGDDVGDLPAFDALDDLSEAGTEVVRVAVDGAEARDELVLRADLRLDGPRAVLAVLEALRAELTGRSP